MGSCVSSNKSSVVIHSNNRPSIKKNNQSNANNNNNIKMSSTNTANTTVASAVAVSSTEVKVVSPAPSLPTLAGKIAIVTGASRGIGQGIALRLARDGAKVVVNYHTDKKSADAVVAAINTVPGSGAIAVQADVSKSGDVDRLFAEAKAKYGRIDIVVANSGIATNEPIAVTSNESFDRVVSVNINGVFYTLRAAANNIENNGRIIVIGSNVKTGVLAGFGPYAMTKAAVAVLANTLAQELGSKGITVNTVHPGAIETDMMAKVSADPVMRSFFENLTPFKRIGTTADLGDAVALLVSDGARWISGQAIDVSGAAK